jgi:hypothetical protein
VGTEIVDVAAPPKGEVSEFEVTFRGTGRVTGFRYELMP